MNRCCEDIQQLLSRVEEGEASPDQAMHVARHLSDCTACRIARARETRLAEMLNSELEELTVGEDFVDAVMETLPREPPRPERRTPERKNWRGLKLAGFVGFMAVLLSRSAPGFTGRLALPANVLPQFGFETDVSLPEGLLGLFRIVAAAVESLAGGASSHMPSLAVGLGLLALIAATALASLIALTAASALVALAARSAQRCG